MTKSPAMNSPVPSMKKHRSASPSQAIPMSARSRTTRSTMSRRFSSMSGLDSWFGNVPSISKQSVVVRHGSRSNSLRGDQASHAAPRVEHDVEGLDDRRIDERHHVLDVVVEDVLRGERPGRPRRRRDRARGNHVADLPEPRLAAQRERLAAHQLDAVVLLRVVRRGDLRAAVVPVARHGEIHHVGRRHAVVDDVGALAQRALDERRRDRRRREPHVARHGDAPGVEVGDEAAADLPRGVLVDLGRVQAAHVVGLEYR